MSRGQECDRPLPTAALARAVEAIEGGATYRAALEALLFELDPRDAHWLMQELRESRGAWAPLTASGSATGTGDRPRALFLGDPLSGTPVALGRLGLETTVLGRDELRLRLARLRALALVEAPARFELARTEPGPERARLPFEDAHFDLVVQERGLPGPRTGWGHDLEECLRVARGELVLVADNRLGYKRAAGAHGVFHVLRPLEWLRAALAPARGERTLAGYRARVRAAGGEGPRAYALYPHSDQFVHVVALDEERPRLPVGPKERRNRFKVVGARLGLFPVLTPSFAVIARRAGSPPARARIERVLDLLAERTGEPRPEVDQLVATRGNTAVFLTRPAGAARDPGDPERDPTGHWCLHLPLSPTQQALVERHARALASLPRTHPDVPVPELLFTGSIEGGHVTLERRVAGHTAPELSDDSAVGARLLDDAARLTARLVADPERPGEAFDAGELERLVAAKFELVLAHAGVPETLARTRELLERARRELPGLRVPRVLYHADLRGKHVQIGADGRVLAILDWGTLEDPGLPYVDLFHLAVHERKQTEGLAAGPAWRRVRDPRTRRAHEARALATYARALRLDEAWVRFVEDAYPVLVGAMAERNWDYSRPRWVREQFDF